MAAAAFGAGGAGGGRGAGGRGVRWKKDTTHRLSLLAEDLM